jgi:hypothetical protein
VCASGESGAGAYTFGVLNSGKLIAGVESAGRGTDGAGNDDVWWKAAATGPT